MHAAKFKFILLTIASFILIQAQSQVYSNKPVAKKEHDLSDSIKASAYPYALPIWGQKATKMGFDLPYSAGLSAQYVWQKSQLIINDLNIGFNNGPQHNLDEIVRFNDARAEANILNIRPDIWILPFLNIYGIFAKSNTSTDVDFGIWVPMDAHVPDGDWQEVAHFNTKANFNGNTTAGFGITPTIGIGGGWMALDVNLTWTDVQALDKPAFVFNFGPRFGKTFKLKKPQQNVAMWVGGFRAKFASGTSGSLPISSLIPIDEFKAKIDQGQAKVTEASQNLESWWTSLSNVQQNNPVNKSKYESGTRILTRASEFLESAESATGSNGGATVQYSLNKKLKDMWNFIVGGQFQLNKHWMVRGEYGFLGTRNQFIGGLQYRFGL
jgi:hypothetical protein